MRRQTTGRPSHLPTLPTRASAALVLLVAAGACDDRAPVRATISVAESLAGADTAGFRRALEPRPFTFPADHGPHPEYRHEWWYFTGNLRAAQAGGDYGFQLTFFRSALRPDSATIRSEWATSQAYMGHFAVADIEAGRFRAFERFDRGALDLAGARRGEDGELRVWVGDWEASLEPSHGAPATTHDAWRIRAAEDGVALDLVLTPEKPVVLQGDRGLSRKGLEPGNASYYYSFTRLRARGTIAVGGDAMPVAGSAWLDREWGTSALGPDLAGWDWFALQLDDGAELMIYRLRRKDGGTDPFSAGTYVAPDGSALPLGPDDFTLDATGAWTSAAGVRYPSGWRIRVPGAALDLRVEPRLRDQELDLAFRYWEGAVAVEGASRAGAVAGVGYVELTGYDDADA